MTREITDGNLKRYLVDSGKPEVTVIAFIGPAGTGKSRRAQLVARNNNVDYLIDDGLVVAKGKIMIGKSAKSEKNLIRAIRRALFQFPEHRQSVIEFIGRNAPCRIMIVATSRSMAEKISRNLGIPKPEKLIDITEVATPQEISAARHERHQNGHHVIPVSQAQLRKNFAGKLVGHLRELLKSKDKHDDERTVVRPPFSFFGNLSIETYAVSQIVEHVVKITNQVVQVKEVKIRSYNDRLDVLVHVDIELKGKSFYHLSRTIQKRVVSAINYFTGMDVRSVDVFVEEVRF